MSGHTNANKVPDYLAPLSPKAIAQQAKKTISSAYAPAFKQLDKQTKQSQAISDKRAADLKYYQAWLDTQEQALQAHADQAYSTLTGNMTGLQDQQKQLFAQQAQNLVAGANARSGNVSNNAQSNAFGTDLTTNQLANEERLNAQQQSTTADILNMSNQLGATRANNLAYIGSLVGKNQSDLQTNLTNIANERSKLSGSETADLQKEIARLGGIEIQKAQSNRDYQTAVQQLGLKTAIAQSEAIDRRDRRAIAQGRLTLAQQTEIDRKAESDRTYQLNKDKFGAQTAKDIYERQHGLGPYRPGKGGAGGERPLTAASQQSIYNRIDKVTAEINNLIAAHHLTPEQAYHAVKNGGYVGGPQHSSTSTTGTGSHSSSISQSQVKVLQESDVQILNAAYNLRNGGIGLTPGDIAALKRHGLSHPGNHYGRVSDTGPSLPPTSARQQGLS